MIIAVVIIARSKLGLTRYVYGLLFLSFAIWSLSFVFLGDPDIYPSVLKVVVHVNYILRLCIGGFVFFSLLVFSRKSWKWLLPAGGGVLAFIIAGSVFQLDGRLTYPTFGMDDYGSWIIAVYDMLLYRIFIILHTLFILCSFIVLISYYRKTKYHIVKAQSRIIIITGLISYLLSAAIIHLIIKYPELGIPNYPDLAMVFFLGGMTYVLFNLGIIRVNPAFAINELIGNIPVGLMLTNELNHVVYANNRFHEIVKVRQEDMYSQNFSVIAEKMNLKLPGDDLRNDFNRKVTVVNMQGEEVHLFLQGVGIRRRNLYLGTLYIFTDISQLENIRKELLKINQNQKRIIAEKTKTLVARDKYLTAVLKIHLLLLREEILDYQEVVDIIGEVSDSGRTYVFLNHLREDGELMMSQVAEYTAPGIRPEIHNPQLQDLAYKDFSVRWLRALSAGEIIKGKIRDFPEREREILAPQEIKSILVIPINVGNEFFGFIGFDNCIDERQWNREEQSLLEIVAHSMGQKIKLMNAEKAKEESQQQLQLYANYLTAAREDERLAISRDIHDDLGQKLSVMKMFLFRIRKSLSTQLIDNNLKELFANFEQQINGLVTSVRSLAQKIRVKTIDDFGLVVAIEHLVRNFEKETGIICSFSTMVDAIDLDPAKANNVYYIVKESLTNVLKHADATSVLIELNKQAGSFHLRISDNGCGINENEVKRKNTLGLKVMKERAGFTGGYLTVKKGKKHGTIVELKIKNLQNG